MLKALKKALQRPPDAGDPPKRTAHLSSSDGDSLTDLQVVDGNDGNSGLHLPGTAVALNGVTYTNAMRFDNWVDPDSAVYREYNLGRQYSRFRVTVGASDLENSTITYAVFRTKVLKARDEPVPIDLDV
jgi:hypothetical protein